MKARELMEDLFSLARPGDFSRTCDTCKAGDPEAEITHVATAMFGTPAVIRAAAEWGAQLLIVHEPLYYNHMDVHSEEAQECEKRELIRSLGLTVYRYHDYPHATSPDIIFEAVMRRLALPGKLDLSQYALARVELDEPMTAVEVARLCEERLGIGYARIAGCRDVPAKTVSCIVGAIGNGIFRELHRPECEILLLGENVEWSACEYARDAAELGHHKSVIMLGHVGSERAGMESTAELIRARHPELCCRYFECGEVFTYTR